MCGEQQKKSMASERLLLLFRLLFTRVERDIEKDEVISKVYGDMMKSDDLRVEQASTA